MNLIWKHTCTPFVQCAKIKSITFFSSGISSSSSSSPTRVSTMISASSWGINSPSVHLISRAPASFTSQPRPCVVNKNITWVPCVFLFFFASHKECVVRPNASTWELRATWFETPSDYALKRYMSPFFYILHSLLNLYTERTLMTTAKLLILT